MRGGASCARERGAEIRLNGADYCIETAHYYPRGEEDRVEEHKSAPRRREAPSCAPERRGASDSALE